MIRSRALMAATAFAAFTGVNAFAADAVPTETFKVLTVDLALEAAQAAIAACKAQGYAVTITMTDRLSNAKIVIVRDGPQGMSSESTRRRPTRPRGCESRPRISPRGYPRPAPSIPPNLTRNSPPVRAACRSRLAKKRSVALQLLAHPAATRTKPAPRPASQRSATG